MEAEGNGRIAPIPEASAGDACPVCGSPGAEPLWRVDASTAAQHFVLREANPGRHQRLAAHIARLWGGDTCAVLRCCRCGFCFSTPFVAGDLEFYDLAYERHNYPAWKWEHGQTVTALRRAGMRDFRLLEVGAGDGAFVREIAPALTSKDRIVCTEYSECGRERIRSGGISCEAVDFREWLGKDRRGRFDVVCLFQVLEHMADLDRAFAALRWLTAEGGHVFIAVPDGDATIFSETNGGLLDMPPNHVGRWNERCFSILASRAGFRVVDHQRERRSAASAVKQLVLYRVLRRSQTRALESWAVRMRPRALRLACAAAVGALQLPAAMAAVLRSSEWAWGAQWVHLQKATPEV